MKQRTSVKAVGNNLFHQIRALQGRVQSNPRAAACADQAYLSKIKMLLVSRMLKYFANEGIVEVSRKGIRILDKKRLRKQCL